MAEAEASHRQRLEARMRELGVEVPSPDSVRLSRWARLQARIAPVDRLLAAREAAEDEEVDDLYKHSTGDADDGPAAARDPQGGALALDGGHARCARASSDASRPSRR